MYADRNWDRDIEHALHFYRGRPSRVIDWGCGTGEHLLRWQAGGSHVVGVDPSRELAAIAKKKGIERIIVSGLGKHACGGGMSELQTCLFAAFSYATVGESVLDCLISVRDRMAHRGIFLFDVLNYSALTPALSYSRTKQSAGIRWTKVSKFDPLTSILDITVHYVPDDAESFIEQHKMRAFTPREIGDHLDIAGFDVLSIFDPESTERLPPRPDSFYFMTAARVRR